MRSIRFFLLAAWLCLSLGAFAQTTTYQVAPFPVGNDNNDGINNPLATITEAIDRAADNDIIKVLAGEYEEGNILVNKSLTITGLGENASLAPAVGDTQLFNITIGGVTIEGLELIGNTDANAILLGGGNGLTIRQNTISGFATGIVVAQNAGVTNLNISNNFINANENGVVINPGAQITGVINDNNLSDNTSDALVNSSNNQIDASFNWWGEATIASVTGAISAPNGNVNNLIDYNPWLNSALDINSNPNDGFQPSFNTLIVRKQNNSSVLGEAIDRLNVEGRLFIYNKISSASAYEAITVDKIVTLSGAGGQNPVLTGLTLESNTTINGNITLNNITLNGYTVNVSTLETSKLSLPLIAAVSLSSQEGEVVGPVITLPEQIESGESIQALGVSISGGVEPLGAVTIQRNAGTEAVINESQGFQSVKTIWDITVGNNNFAPRDVTFQWLAADNNGVDLNTIVIWKNPGPTEIVTEWIPVNADDPKVAVQEGDLISVTVSVSSFSQYTVSDANKPLPVELTSFSASLLEPHVELNWETASEINSDFFAVERSENGKDFKEVGRLKAAGDSDVPLQYRYIDEQIANRLSGSVFYRLRTVDFDGSFEYSDITTVTLSDDDIPMITAFAREGQQSLKLFTRAIEPGDYRVWITDLSGRKVFEQDLQLAPKESYELGVGNLSQSIYLIRCEGRELALSNKFRVEEID